MDNQQKSRSQQIYEQYEDALFRLAIHQAAEEEGKELQATRERLQSMPEFQPSEEALRRFSKQLDQHLRRQRMEILKRKVVILLQRGAIGVLVVLLVFGAALTTVDAFRLKVTNLWLKVHPQYTIFRLAEAEPGTAGNQLIVDWANAYVPTYIPEGYRVSSLSIKQSAREIIFEHGTGPITYMELRGSTSPMIDTEDADLVETVAINGHSGTLVQKHGLSTVVLEMDERLFLIQAWTDREVALRIVQGVKYVK